MTIVRDEDGEEVRRSYSICVPARSGELAVGVRHLPGGRFSGFVADGLRAGDLLDVLPPAGRFGPEIYAGVSATTPFVAAGSGITPVISIVATVLAEEPGSRCTRGLRQPPHRHDHVRRGARGPEEPVPEPPAARPRPVARVPAGAAAGGAPGRGAARRAARRAGAARRPSTSGTCAGRSGWCRTPGRSCASAAWPRSTSTASCSTPTPPRSRARRRGAAQRGRDGHDRARRPPLDVPGDGGSILEAALRNRPDAPYACKGGVCGTCRCRIVEGEVAMDHSYALEEDEVDAGVVLACQAHPRSERIVLDFDAR